MNQREMNFEKTTELIHLSKRLWIAARTGTSGREPDEEAEKEFWHHMALLKIKRAVESGREVRS